MSSSSIKLEIMGFFNFESIYGDYFPAKVEAVANFLFFILQMLNDFLGSYSTLDLALSLIF
jgi:hypothetical protein